MNSNKEAIEKLFHVTFRYNVEISLNYSSSCGEYMIEMEKT